MLNPQPISYRNGLYQGPFSPTAHSREGFGLAFTTDNHLTMASTWHENQANQATFIFYNHAHFVYGFWKMSIPHGFNAIKMGHAVIYAWFDEGQISGKFLVVYQQYNLAVVLQKRRGDGQGQFLQISKGDLYSDQQLNRYIKTCEWPQFQQSWKTLIKFMSAYLVHQQNSNSKPRTKLQLLNHSYYRYGFDEGLAIIFDDQYNIISAGLHRKANLKSLGIKFTKQKFVQQGNFANQNQIYAFNYGSRPQNKIGKLYNNHLLKSVEFVNQFITNPAKILIRYVEFVVNSNLLRKLLAGQITSRKIDASYASPQNSERNHKNLSSGRKDKQQTPRLDQYKQIKKEQQKKRLRQQKIRLQLYKRQLAETINRKSDVKQIQIQNPQQQRLISPYSKQRQSQIITKPPVDIATRVSHRLRTDAHKQKSRSPIFTPQHFDSRSRSISPSRVSPFKQRMRSKIFREDGRYDVNNVRASQRKRYFYQTIQQELYPKHGQEFLSKNYQSPHQELDFSRSRGFDNDQVVPLSMRKQELQDQRKYSNEQQVRDMKRETKNDNISDNRNPEKKNIRYMKRSQNPMSFRGDQNADPQPRRQQSEMRIPNIVITSPYQKKSTSQRKLIRGETQIQNQQRQKNYNIEGLHNRKNNVYLRQANIIQQPSPSTKQKKQIKGNTYLQKYNRSKNATPQKPQNKPKAGGQLKNYNKTIKTFNENNRVYEIVQSPKKEDIRSSKVEISEEVKYKPNVETTPVKKKYQYVFN